MLLRSHIHERPSGTMTNWKHLTIWALSSAQVLTVSARTLDPAKRQATTAKYCPDDGEICFSEWVEPASSIIYRVAIPDVASAPFDLFFQLVAPKDKAGWAAVGWGGRMNYNPLTVAWPNGDSVVVSSRWST